MQREWRLQSVAPSSHQQLVRTFGLHPLVARCLAQRGITSASAAEQFLRCPLDHLHNPFLLKGLPEAVAVLREAMARRAPILIYGDYDVDGLSSVALLTRVLREFGALVTPYVPNRLEDGYGLHAEALQQARANGIRLVVTVDCGITARDEVALAKQLGMQVIIIDHHHPVAEQFPSAADAVIDPLQDGCRYPNKGLSSVGLAFKVAQGLFDGAFESVEPHLDLVGLGTIADMVPLIGENRTLVKRGLAQLSQSSKPGVRALIQVARITKPWLDATDVSHALSPRLNASGRMRSPEPALRLLLTDDLREAEECAKILHRDNALRQRIEREVLRGALMKVEREVNFAAHRIIVLADAGWHAGVLGTIATRLVERFYRPTFVLTIQGDRAKGSGRSIQPVHLVEVLQQVRHLLVRYGGHRGACGVELMADQLGPFTEAINAVAAGTLSDAALVPSLAIAAEVPLSELAPEVIRQMEDLAPFGVGNPRPILATRGLTIKSSPRFIGQEGVRMWVTDGRTTCQASAMRLPQVKWSRQFSSAIDLAYTPRLVERDGRCSIALDIADVRETELGATRGQALVTNPVLMH